MSGSADRGLRSAGAAALAVEQINADVCLGHRMPHLPTKALIPETSPSCVPSPLPCQFRGFRGNVDSFGFLGMPEPQHHQPSMSKHTNLQASLLAGRVLEYSWADSGCSAKQGLAALGELLSSRLSKNLGIHAMIGPGCSSACEVTNHLAGNLLPQVSHSFCKVLDQLQSLFDVWLCSMQVSHSCTSPKFSEKDEFALVRVHSIKLHMYASDANMRLCFRIVG